MHNIKIPSELEGAQYGNMSGRDKTRLHALEEASFTKRINNKNKTSWSLSKSTHTAWQTFYF